MLLVERTEKMNHSLKAAAVLLMIILQIPLPAFAQQAAASAPSQAQAPQKIRRSRKLRLLLRLPRSASAAPAGRAPISASRLWILRPIIPTASAGSRPCTAPYTPYQVPSLSLTNSPRINDLIQNGKLMLSLEDAISLALENNMDIAVQRYTPGSTK